MDRQAGWGDGRAGVSGDQGSRQLVCLTLGPVSNPARLAEGPGTWAETKCQVALGGGGTGEWGRGQL